MWQDEAEIARGNNYVWTTIKKMYSDKYGFNLSGWIKNGILEAKIEIQGADAFFMGTANLAPFPGRTFQGPFKGIFDATSPYSRNREVTGMVYGQEVSDISISGDVLEALFYPIPPGPAGLHPEDWTAGYVKAFNLQTNQTYFSHGRLNPNLSWDENGEYEILCPSGIYRMWAWSPCYMPNVVERVEHALEEPKNTTSVNFRLLPSFRTLNFTVVDTKGAPIGGATIDLKETPGRAVPPPLYNLTTTTNEKGEAWLTLEGTVAPCQANYNLTISKGPVKTSTTIWVAIPLCQTIADPGNTTLIEVPPSVVWNPPPPNPLRRIKVTLSAAQPSPFSPSDLTINPIVVDEGDVVTISVKVINTGITTLTQTVTLKVNSQPLATKEVTLGGGESSTVSWLTSSEWIAGTYNVDVEGLTGSFTIRNPSASISLSALPYTFDMGGSTVIGGSTSPAYENTKVKIETRRSSGTWYTLATVSTKLDGSYSYKWTPSEAGQYEIRALLEPDVGHDPATSSTIGITVEERADAISLILEMINNFINFIKSIFENF
jgi:hypothetical protein